MHDCTKNVVMIRDPTTTLAGMEAPQYSTEPLKFSVEALQIPVEAPFGAYLSGLP
jgi:hypothetical protein